MVLMRVMVMMVAMVLMMMHASSEPAMFWRRARACISSIIFSSGRAGEACGRLAETGLRRSPEDWLAMRLRSSASART
eukprot:6213787-Pleurochrysis_carterae.AAC.6